MSQQGKLAPDLERFVAAQETGGLYDRAMAELRAGRKEGHWMWFVFPQLTGLGHSETARRYAISGVAEARAYLDHPVLGPRLVECARALAGLPPSSAEQIFGALDATKLRSSLTLFMRARPEEPLFSALIDTYFDGRPDPLTESRLGPP